MRLKMTDRQLKQTQISSCQIITAIHNLTVMKFLLTTSATLLTPLSLHAAVLITPTSLTNESGVSEFFPAINMINDSGLSGAATIANYTTITHGNAGNTTAWTTDDPAPAGGDYYAQGGTAATFTLLLGDSYDLTDFVFWGYHFGAANGNEGREFLLEFSTDGGSNYTSSTTVSNALDEHTASAADTLNLGGTFTADAVRLTITDNHFGGTPAGGDRIGLGEMEIYRRL